MGLGLGLRWLRWCGGDEVGEGRCESNVSMPADRNVLLWLLWLWLWLLFLGWWVESTTGAHRIRMICLHHLSTFTSFWTAA